MSEKKLSPEQLNFYEEAGAIVKAVEKLKTFHVDVIFDSFGMRVTEIGKEIVRSEYFYTARELMKYANGIEDGANAVKDYPVIKNTKD